MLDFIPYFQIVIGLYISFCFEKLIQSLLWSDEFTSGLSQFYKDWGTLAWHKEDGNEEAVLQQCIETSIKSYVSRTQKLGLFMLVSVTTILLAYCWAGLNNERNEQLMLAFSVWNTIFFFIVFWRKIWSNWWIVILIYVALVVLTGIALLLVVKYQISISHTLKVSLAMGCVLGVTFPLIVELCRARIRSDFFLDYLKSCRDKFSRRCSVLLLSIVNGEYVKSKYLLQLKDAKVSALKNGEPIDNDKLLGTLMATILKASEEQALKILTEDNRTAKLLFYCKLREHYQPVILDRLECEDDLFKLSFSCKKKK